MHYWQILDELVETSEIVIDRPRGSTHPRFPDFVYPFDYGYLAGTQAGDGSGIDVWIGSLPERGAVGVLTAVDLDKRDSEIKILLGCTPAEMEQIHAAHNIGEQAALLIRRESGSRR